MADRIQYIDNDGDHIYPVTHERGVLDSKGVNLESKLLRPLTEWHLDGKGNTFNSISWQGVIPGHKYRFVIKSWPNDSVTQHGTAYAQCAIWSNSSATKDNLLAGAYGNETIEPSYEVTAPGDCTQLVLGGRVNSGMEGVVTVEDITALAAVDAKFLRPISEMSLVGNGHLYVGKANPEVLAGHRYRIWIKSWPHENVIGSGGGPAYMFIVYSASGSTTTELMRVSKTGTLNDFYDVTLRDDADRMIVGGCVDSGQLGIVAIEDITAIGGLVDDVDEIKRNSVAYDMAVMEPQKNAGMCVNNSGNYVASNYYNVFIYPVLAGNNYYFSGQVPKTLDFYVIYWFDSNNEYLSRESYKGSTSSAKNYQDVKVTAPEGAAYLYMNVTKRTSASYELKEEGEVITAQEMADRLASQDDKRGRLRLLCIGNSYSQDVLSYVPFLLENMGRPIDVTIGILMLSSSSIDDHIEKFENEAAAYEFDLYDGSSGAWQKVGTTAATKKTIQWALENYEWDVIVTHSYHGSTPAEYIGTANKFANLLYTAIGYNVKLGWMMHQLRPSVTNYGANKSEQQMIDGYNTMSGKIQQILDNSPYEMFFCPGTAIQNARTLAQLKILGAYADEEANTSGYGYLCCADGNHLQEGLPCQIAAYSVILTLLDYMGMSAKSVFGDTSRIDSDWTSGRNIPSPHGTPVGSTDDNCRMGQLCAIMAHKHPFEITDMNQIVNPTW